MIIQPDERDFYIKLGYRLRSTRTKLGITLDEIASVIDMPPMHFEKYENAELAIPVYHLFPVLEYMKYPIELGNIN